MRITLEEVAYRVLPRVEAGRALAQSEWLVLVKAAEVFLETEPVTVTPEEAADNVERFLIVARGNRAWRIRALCTMVELLPISVYGKRFTELPLAARQRIVSEQMMRGGKLWSVAAKIRFLVTMGAYGDARSANTQTGFVPIPLRRRFHPDAASLLQLAS